MKASSYGQRVGLNMSGTQPEEMKMLGLLRRHEVEILLKAGHKRTEIARLTGISCSSIQRIAGEATIEHSMTPPRGGSGESAGQASLRASGKL